MNEIKSIEQLKKKNEELLQKLTEAEDTLAAIRNGMVDAVVVSGQQGDQVFTLKGADYAYRILIETMNEGAATISSDHTMMYCNKRFSNILRTPCNKIIGKSIDEFISPEDVKAFQSIISQGFRGAVSGEVTLLRKDGKKTPVLLSCNPLSIDFPGVCIVFTDLTELKIAQKKLKKAHDDLEKKVNQRTQDLIQKSIELAESNKELEAFCYSISHDLTAPLRSIAGFSQVLVEDYADKIDAQGKDCIQRVQTATQRMGQLIDDLLRLSRLSREEITKEKVDLTSLIKVVLEKLQRAEPSRRVSTKIQDKMIVQGDKKLIEILLDNLIGNAWKFTGKNRQQSIEIGSTVRDGEAVFFIKDNGAGFDMTYADKLFMPFQRLHSNEEFPGTGIGLAIVSRIIHRHGGKIWAEGEIGKGATFYFTLTKPQPLAGNSDRNLENQ